MKSLHHSGNIENGKREEANQKKEKKKEKRGKFSGLF